MIRRIVDVTLASLGLFVTWPIILIAGLAVKLTSQGPMFYYGSRVGQHGRPFKVMKLRTMTAGTESAGPGITAGNDPRITGLGRRLRNWKLDELPQLFNVIRGDMSLVGPRPEDTRYVAMYTPAQRRILEYRPGLTGAASIEYRDEEAELAGAENLDQAYTVIMSKKIDIDLNYLDSRTILSDLGILWKTATAVLRTDN